MLEEHFYQFLDVLVQSMRLRKIKAIIKRELWDIIVVCVAVAGTVAVVVADTVAVVVAGTVAVVVAGTVAVVDDVLLHLPHRLFPLRNQLLMVQHVERQMRRVLMLQFEKGTSTQKTSYSLENSH